MSRAHRYEPDINPTYAEMAAWYGAAVIPARPYKPRDKAYATDCTSWAVSDVEPWRAAVARLRLRYAA